MELEEKIRDVFEQCISITKERNAQYDNAWESMEPYSLLDIAGYKIARIKNMWKNKENNADQIDDAIKDAINYLFFLHISLK